MAIQVYTINLCLLTLLSVAVLVVCMGGDSGGGDVSPSKITVAGCQCDCLSPKFAVFVSQSAY